VYIHSYKDSPTSGGIDGTLVSENTGLTPIATPLILVGNECSPIKLAVRCDSGYATYGSTVITPVGTTYDKWALAPDSAGSPGTFGAYGAALTISGQVGATNQLFWAKAKAVNGEAPQNDTTVDLQVAATIQAV